MEKFDFEHKLCMTCPNSWKKVITFECDKRDSFANFPRLKLVTIATAAGT